MKEFLKETADFLKGRVVMDASPVKIGEHYYDGYIETVTKIEEGRAYYDLFRLEPENISPCWTGNRSIEDYVEGHIGRISDETYNEVFRRYTEYIAKLRDRLF